MNKSSKKLLHAMLGLFLALLLLPVQAFTALAVEAPQTITYHMLTVDPNGGTFADGSSEAKTFQLRDTGYMKPEDYRTAIMNGEGEVFISREGYLPLGFGTSKSGPVTVELYDLANTRFTEDTTLYVIWGKAVQMTIYSNGGILFQNTQDGPVSLPDPYVSMVPVGDLLPVEVLKRMAVRDGYYFAGLSTDAAGQHFVSPVERDGVFCYIAPETDVTYYVQWAKILITEQPQDVNTAIGSKAVFTVSTEGEGPTYQWQHRAPNGTWKNSTATGYNTAAMTVNINKAAWNGFQFRCVITDADGNKVITNVATLTVKTAITAQPKNISTAIGTTAKFTVTATGAGLTYQWQHRAPSGTWKNSTATGYNTAAMTVNINKASWNGFQFRCVITDANGVKTVSNAATLKVVPITITAQPKNINTAIGTTAKFSVAATGTSLTYQWQHRAPSGTWKNSTATGYNTATMTVNINKASWNGYQFRCVITDADGNKAITNVATLTVKTVITAQPKNINTAIGTTAKFTVTATGAGPTYQWQHRAPNGTWKNSTATGYNTAVMTVNINKASWNGYQFRCVITDANGNKVITNVATLTVKTTITVQPKDVTAVVGSDARFTVTATGAGLTYQWQFKSANGKWTNSGATGCKTSTLTVTPYHSMNGYLYRCVITDANGNKTYSKAVVLTVK